MFQMDSLLLRQLMAKLSMTENEFFKQREIYYGEGGLFEETWSGYPNSRGLNKVMSLEK